MLQSLKNVANFKCFDGAKQCAIASLFWQYKYVQGHQSNSRAKGGRSLEKGTCTDYDIIMTSEFKRTGSGGLKSCGARGRILL